MITKEDRKKSRKLRRNEPLEVSLTVQFNYGEGPDDTVTVMNDRKIPMVGSVFANRDRIVRAFFAMLIKAGLREPRVTRKVFGFGRWRRKK